MAAAIGLTAAWLGLLALGGWWAAGRGLRQPTGWPRVLGAAVLAWGWTIVGDVILGQAGWLARGPLLAWAAAGAGLAAVLRLVLPAPKVEHNTEGACWEPAGTVALGLALWAVVAIGVPAWLMPVQPRSDGPIYHLYFAARWWKAGRIFLVPAPFGESAVTYLPSNGELWFASLMTLWGGDRLAKVGQAPFFVLAAAAVVASARSLGVGRPAAVIAAVWFACSLPVLLFSFEPNTDTIFVAWYLAAAYFLLRYATGAGGLGTLALGALAAGAAWGTKITGTVFVPPLLAGAAVAVLVRERTGRGRLLHLAALALLPGVLVGYWFVRNAWLTGNPLYPLQISAFGHVWLRGWFDASAMKRNQFYWPASDLRLLVDNVLLVLDPREAPVWLAAVVLACALARRAPRGRWVAACSAVAIVNLLLYWVLIPYRSQQRFMLPAAGLAAVPLAALLHRSRALRWLAAGLLAVHLLTPQTWPVTAVGARVPWGLSHVMQSQVTGLLNVPVTPAAIARAVANPGASAYAFANLLIGAGAALCALAWGRALRRPAPGRWMLALLATTALVGATSWATWSALASRLAFPAFPQYERGWARLDQLAGPGGARVAYAGTNRAYYLMGPNLRNDVVYVNIDAHRTWRLHDYHRQAIAAGSPNWPDPRPGWDRLHPDYHAWRANLAAEHVDLLVVTPADPRDGLFNLADPEGFPIERVWADAHPESFTLLYGGVERDPNFRIYRVRGGGRSDGGSAFLAALGFGAETSR